ncbi:hypothetical protein FIU83_06310 [Halomonas sp. THAF5a]|uniref:hypothetical protein n=1 Tax=Halomonas sp. THAF5a TaxID=2587844 RepID=UPI0012691A5F|nr:hypothetical protein [Halomonas sp. THAF5a]QFU01248.1 hypothetical protein FIU83_06310 [Halomonas sp. THAF5a]
MAEVIPLQQLTSAHRCLMARIQDLWIDVSLQTDHVACYHYSGTVHSVYVHLVPPAHQAESDGGDGSHRASWSARLYLPPHELAQPDSLKALGDIITKLEGYLPSPGGAA